MSTPTRARVANGGLDRDLGHTSPDPERRPMDEAEEEGDEAPRRKGRKRAIRDDGMVSTVRDETGQRVQESFEQFLEEYASFHSQIHA